MCPECSVSVYQICSYVAIDSFGLSNALFLDMLARFSSCLDMLFLGLSDALLHLIAIFLYGDFTLQYVSKYCHPKTFVPMCTLLSVLHHGASYSIFLILVTVLFLVPPR